MTTNTTDIKKALNYDAESGKCLVPDTKKAPAWAGFIAIDSQHSGEVFYWTWKSVNLEDNSSCFQMLEIGDTKFLSPSRSQDYRCMRVSSAALVEGAPYFKMEDSLRELFTGTAVMMKSFVTTNYDDGSGNGHREFSMYDPSGSASDTDVLAILRVQGCETGGTCCEHEHDCCGGTYLNPLGKIQRETVDCGVLITVKQGYYVNV